MRILANCLWGSRFVAVAEEPRGSIPGSAMARSTELTISRGFNLEGPGRRPGQYRQLKAFQGYRIDEIPGFRPGFDEAGRLQRDIGLVDRADAQVQPALQLPDGGKPFSRGIGAVMDFRFNVLSQGFVSKNGFRRHLRSNHLCVNSVMLFF